MSGRLFVVGVGPGDPDLVTLKALRVIQSGATIAYPVAEASNGSKSHMARDIVACHIPNDAKEFGFAVPIRIERNPGQNAYDDAASHFAELLRSNENVVLLCEGDPLFYGSAIYLLERLTSEFECEIIPGITSLTACAAAANRPLAIRNDRLKILPAPMDATALEVELANCEAAAIIKVGRHFEKLLTIIRKLDLQDTAILIERATGEQEKITLLKELPQREIPYFSTILIHKEVGRGDRK